MSTEDEFQRRRSEQLEKEARERLEDDDYEGALRLAEQLEALRYTAAFEIAALAHAGMGDVEAAVAVLERGLSLAPNVWVNWQLLGNYLSDLGRFDDAGRAYAKAHGCPHVWSASVRLNEAILENRRGDHAAALALLDAISDDDLTLEVLDTRLSALARLGKHQEVMAMAREAVDAADELEGEVWASIVARQLRAEWTLGASVGELRERAIEALDLHHAGSTALLELIRELRENPAATGRYYRILLHIGIPVGHPWRTRAAGYFTICQVRADSHDEAFALACELEDSSMAPTTRLDEHELLDESLEVGEAKGVYARSGRLFYERED